MYSSIKAMHVVFLKVVKDQKNYLKNVFFMLKFHWLISIKGNQANDAVEHLLIVEILNNKNGNLFAISHLAM